MKKYLLFISETIVVFLYPLFLMFLGVTFTVGMIKTSIFFIKLLFPEETDFKEELGVSFWIYTVMIIFLVIQYKKRSKKVDMFRNSE